MAKSPEMHCICRFSVSLETVELEMTLSPLTFSVIQTSGYLFRREAWQCSLLGEGRASQALALAHEDQEGIHSL